jgi:hypothetical protein
LVRDVRYDIEYAWLQPEIPSLIISNGLWFEAFDPERTIWKSRRLSWDWLRDVEREGLKVTGKGSSPMGPKWTPFELDLETGEVRGGSYTGLT